MALTKVTGDFIKAGSITQGHLHSSHGITTSHIGEGDKLFFTNARVDSRVGSLSTSNLSEGTNLYYTDARVDARIAAADTGDLSEGSNLYYTQARFNTAFAAKSTSDLSEGTNLYFTNARADARIAAASTSDLSEGTNLYYTDARADARVALIVDSAPGTLNTLNELAAALGDDANFSTTVTNSIATKLPLAGGTLTGALNGTTATFSGIGQFAGAIRITENGTAQHILIGNQDSGGVNKPGMIRSANASLEFGYGNSWSGEGGTMTTTLTLHSNSNATFAGTITASGGNSTQWNTAYGWGNHASAGYLTSSTGFPKGADIGTSADLNNYTSNGYYHQNSNALAAGGSNYPSAVAGMLTVKADGVMVYQTYQGYGANSTWERKYYNGSWQSWHKQWDSGEFANNSGNWDTAYGWGDHGAAGYLTSYTETDTLATVTGRGASTSSVVTLTGGSKIVVQGGTDGGGSRGIFMWTNTDTNWGIYMSTAGSTNNIAGGTAPSGLNGETSHSIRFRIASNADNGFIWENHNNAALMSLRGSAGDLITSSSMRAPIFYDSNNTSYYINPADNSELSTATFTLNANSTISLVAAGTNASQIKAGAGDELYLGGNNTWQMRLSGGNILMDNGGYALSNGSMRAPIFYDSNDTNAYINANVGNLVLLESAEYAGGMTVKNAGASGYLNMSITTSSHADGWGWRFANQHGHTGSVTKYFWVTYSGGDAYASGSFRAPIFYDSTDTGYYLHPNSKSFLGTIHFNGSASGTGAGSEIGRNHAYDTMELKGYGAELMIGAQHTEININYRTCNGGVSGHTPTTWKWRAGTSSNWSDHYMGLIQSSSSMRAPIFYDSNDTGYYINPYGQSKIRNNNAQEALIIEGDYPQLTIRTTNIADASIHFDAGFAKKFNIGPGAGGAEEDEFGFAIYSGPRGTHYGTPFRISADTGYVQVGDKDHPGYPLDILGTAYSSADFRAPIFYDSNDTNYYFDPNSTSLSGKLRSYLLFNDYGAGVVGSYSASRYQLVFAMGNAYKGALDGTSVAGGYGLWYSHPNAGGVAGNLNSHGLMNIDNGNWQASFSGSTRAAIDMRAPIFYDLSNTGYYVDPASYSSMWGVAVRGDLSNTGTGNQIFFWGTGNSTTSAIGFKANGGNFANPTGSGDGYNTYLTMDTAGRGWVFRQGTGGTNFTSLNTSGWILNNGVWQANASMRSPIFYDSNNTGYYVDPNSTSRLLNLDFGVAGYYLKAGDWGVRQQTPYGWIQFGPANTSHAHIYTDLSNFYFNKQIQLSGGSLINQNDIRAGVFYDVNNTTYYADPGSTSNMNAVTLVGTFSGQNGYFNQDLAVGFNSGAIGGKVNIQINSNNGIGVKNNLNGRSGATGLLQYTSASYASSGYNMVFQAVPPSGTDQNMLLCYINGNIVNRFNSYGQYSDIKLKENIVDTTPKLEDVKRIRIRNFNFKGDPYKQIGVVAQEFEEVFPGLVEDKEVPDEEGTTKTVKYSVLVPILVKAMQEQQAIIDDLKSRLETLENQ